MGGKQLLASAAHRLRTDDPGLGGGCLQKSWYGYHTTCSVSMIIDINIWIFNPLKLAGFTVMRNRLPGNSGIHTLHPVIDNHCPHFGSFHSAKSNKEAAI
jgi:hypothetical protein